MVPVKLPENRVKPNKTQHRSCEKCPRTGSWRFSKSVSCSSRAWYATDFKNMNHTQLCGAQGDEYFAIIKHSYRGVLSDKKRQRFNWGANSFWARLDWHLLWRADKAGRRVSAPSSQKDRAMPSSWRQINRSKDTGWAKQDSRTSYHSR